MVERTTVTNVVKSRLTVLVSVVMISEVASSEEADDGIGPAGKVLFPAVDGGTSVTDSCDCDDELEFTSLVDVSLVVSVEVELMLLLSVVALETSEDTTDSVDEEVDDPSVAEVEVVGTEDEKLSVELDALVSGTVELLVSAEPLNVGAEDVSALVSVVVETDCAVVELDESVDGKVFVSVTVKVLVTPVTSVTVCMGRLELEVSDPDCATTFVSVTMTVVPPSKMLVTTVTVSGVKVAELWSVADDVSVALEMTVAVALLVMLQSSQGP
jgi:hypothetical protein